MNVPDQVWEPVAQEALLRAGERIDTLIEVSRGLRETCEFMVQEMADLEEDNERLATNVKILEAENRRLKEAQVRLTQLDTMCAHILISTPTMRTWDLVVGHEVRTLIDRDILMDHLPAAIRLLMKVFPIGLKDAKNAVFARRDFLAV